MADLMTRIIITAQDNATGVLNTLRDNAGKAAIAIAGVFAKKSLDDAAAFEFQLDKVAAKGGYTAAEMAKLTEFAKNVGTEFGKSGTESAQGLEILAAAGLSATSAMKTLPAILALAKIEGTSMDVASQGLTDTLTIMGLGFDQAGRAADVLSKGANLSTTSVVELENAFSYAGSQAKSAGIGFEETTAILDVLAGAGLRGERAGTGLRAVLEELQKPTSAARQELQKMGINTSNLTDVMEQLRINGAEKSKAAILAFGTVAGPTVQALMKKGAEGINEYKQKLEDANGFAIKAAQTMGTNLTSSLDRLGAVFTNLRTEFATPFLEPLTKGANALSSVISNNVPQAIHLLEGLAAIIGVQMVKSATALTAAFGATSIGASILSARIIALGTSISTTISAFLPLNKMLAVFAAFEIGETIGKWLTQFESFRIGALNITQGLIGIKETVTSIFSGDFFSEEGKKAYEEKIAFLNKSFDEMRKNATDVGIAEKKAADEAKAASETKIKAVEEQKNKVEEFAKIQIEKLKESTKILQDEYKIQSDAIKTSLESRIEVIKANQKSVIDGEKQIFEATKKSNDDQIDLADKLAKERKKLTDEVYKDAITKTKEGTTERKEVEQQYSQDLAQIETDRLSVYQSTISAMNQAAQGHRDKAFQLGLEIVDAEQRKHDGILAIQRAGMTDEQVIESKKTELYNRISKYKQLMIEGDYQKAKEYSEKTEQLALELGQTERNEYGKISAFATSRYEEVVNQSEAATNKLKELQTEQANDLQGHIKEESEKLSEMSSKVNDINQELAKKHFLAIDVDPTQIKDAKKAIDEIPTEKHVKIYATTVQQNSTGGQIQHFATGGQPKFVRREGALGGYGGGDTVPAMLEPGEWIIKKESVAKYGDGFMAQLNEGKLDIPKFRTGGAVDGVKDKQRIIQNQIDFKTEELSQYSGFLNRWEYSRFSALSEEVNELKKRLKSTDRQLRDAEEQDKYADEQDKQKDNQDKEQKQKRDAVYKQKEEYLKTIGDDIGLENLRYEQETQDLSGNDAALKEAAIAHQAKLEKIIADKKEKDEKEAKRLADEQKRADDEKYNQIYKQKEETYRSQGDDVGLENLRYEKEQRSLSSNPEALKEAEISHQAQLDKIAKDKKEKDDKEAQRLADEQEKARKKADDDAKKLADDKASEIDKQKIEGFKLTNDDAGLENYNYEKEKKSLAGNEEALKQAELNHKARLAKIKPKDAGSTGYTKEPHSIDDLINNENAQYDAEQKRKDEYRESQAQLWAAAKERKGKTIYQLAAEAREKAMGGSVSAPVQAQQQTSNVSSSQTITIQFKSPSGSSASGSFDKSNANNLINILREAAASGSTF